MIVAIVAVQGKVAWDTFIKIDRFKKIIPADSTFKTVKVFIPESQIKEINVDDIFANLKKYSSPYGQDSYHEVILEPDTIEKFKDVDEDNISEFLVEEIEEDQNMLIWITKGTDEKRIEHRLLTSFESLGWNRID